MGYSLKYNYVISSYLILSDKLLVSNQEDIAISLQV